jgi:hypothetical protein
MPQTRPNADVFGSGGREHCLVSALGNLRYRANGWSARMETLGGVTAGTVAYPAGSGFDSQWAHKQFSIVARDYTD